MRDKCRRGEEEEGGLPSGKGLAEERRKRRRERVRGMGRRERLGFGKGREGESGRYRTDMRK